MCCMAVLSIHAALAGETVIPQGQIHRLELYTLAGKPMDTKNRDLKILINTGFALAYSEALKNPLWVVYRLGNIKDQSEELVFERPNSFQIDLRTTAAVSHDDYTSSGYDRGHMCPNYAMRQQYGQLAQLETFMMSNICPQKPALNQGSWQALESLVANRLSQQDVGTKVKDLWVITGPVFYPGREINTLKNDPDGVPIPHAFFKIIARRKSYQTYQAMAFIFCQDVPRNQDPEECLTTVSEIQDLTGFDFFTAFGTVKQRNLETRVLDLDWNRLEQ